MDDAVGDVVDDDADRTVVDAVVDAVVDDAVTRASSRPSTSTSSTPEPARKNFDASFREFVVTKLQARARGKSKRDAYARVQRAVRCIQARWRESERRAAVRRPRRRRRSSSSSRIVCRADYDRVSSPRGPSSAARSPPPAPVDRSRVPTAQARPDYHAMASRIARAWRRHLRIRVFRRLRDLVASNNEKSDPASALRRVNPAEAAVAGDPSCGTHVRFRLGGETFPPEVVYKIYTHRPVTDVCAFAPRDYAASRAAAAGSRDRSSGAFYTLVPIRPRWRGERRSLRTFAVVSLRPAPAFSPRHRRLSAPTDAFELHPDIRSYRTALTPRMVRARREQRVAAGPRRRRAGRARERDDGERAARVDPRRVHVPPEPERAAGRDGEAAARTEGGVDAETVRVSSDAPRRGRRERRRRRRASRVGVDARGRGRGRS